MDKEKEIHWTNFITVLHKAKEEAITRGINANTIIIDDKLRYVKPFCFAEFPPVTLFPPMIMGMELRMAKLPCEADFVIYNNPRREQEKIIKSYQKLAVEKFAEKLKDIISDNKERFINQEDTDPFGVTEWST